jgi:hypothetical protein
MFILWSLAMPNCRVPYVSAFIWPSVSMAQLQKRVWGREVPGSLGEVHRDGMPGCDL